MDNVLQIDIDPDIVLDEDRIKGMPDQVKGNLLATLTIGAQKYNCHWTELTWEVKVIRGQPVIYVKPKKCEFNPDKEYGNYVLVSDESNIPQGNEVCRVNAELVVPEKYRSKIRYFSEYSDGHNITVTEDNYEQLASTITEIGSVIIGQPYWAVGWKYIGETTEETI